MDYNESLRLKTLKEILTLGEGLKGFLFIRFTYKKIVTSCSSGLVLAKTRTRRKDLNHKKKDVET